MISSFSKINAFHIYISLSFQENRLMTVCVLGDNVSIRNPIFSLRRCLVWFFHPKNSNCVSAFQLHAVPFVCREKG